MAKTRIDVDGAVVWNRWRLYDVLFMICRESKIFVAPKRSCLKKKSVVVTNTRVSLAEPLSHLHYAFVSFHDTRRSLRARPKKSTIRKPKTHLQNAAMATILSA
jgi:hypothetical protein